KQGHITGDGEYARRSAQGPRHQEAAASSHDFVVGVVKSMVWFRGGYIHTFFERCLLWLLQLDGIIISADRPEHVEGSLDRARAGQPAVDNFDAAGIQGAVDNGVEAGQGIVADEFRSRVKVLVRVGGRDDTRTR